MYPFPFCSLATVLFTCTAENLPGSPTTQSKLFVSPNGRLTGSPFSSARDVNTDSAHCPRSFLSSIIFGIRRLIFANLHSYRPNHPSTQTLFIRPNPVHPPKPCPSSQTLSIPPNPVHPPKPCPSTQTPSIHPNPVHPPKPCPSTQTLSIHPNPVHPPKPCPSAQTLFIHPNPIHPHLCH